MSEPTVFIPHAYERAPIIRETRVVTPLTAERDYSAYESPAWRRWRADCDAFHAQLEAALQKMEADLAHWKEHGGGRPKEINSAPAVPGTQLATS